MGATKKHQIDQQEEYEQEHGPLCCDCGRPLSECGVVEEHMEIGSECLDEKFEKDD